MMFDRFRFFEAVLRHHSSKGYGNHIVLGELSNGRRVSTLKCDTWRTVRTCEHGMYRRSGELLNLKLSDIDSHRMVINVIQGKGNKDIITIVSPSVLVDLRTYFKEWKPKNYLFEGQKGNKYSPESVSEIIKNASKKTEINKIVTPHMLRHSFATHLFRGRNRSALYSSAFRT